MIAVSNVSQAPITLKCGEPFCRVLFYEVKEANAAAPDIQQVRNDFDGVMHQQRERLKETKRKEAEDKRKRLNRNRQVYTVFVAISVIGIFIGFVVSKVEYAASAVALLGMLLPIVLPEINKQFDE